MNCQHLRQQLDEAPWGRWSESERLAAQQHAATCPACEAALRDELAIGNALATLTELDAPIEHEGQLAELPKRPSRRRRSTRGFLSPVSLVMLLVGGAAQWFGGDTQFAWSNGFARSANLIELALGTPSVSAALLVFAACFALAYRVREVPSKPEADRS